MSDAIQYLVNGFQAACVIGKCICSGLETLLHVNYVIVSSIFRTLGSFVGALKTGALAMAAALLDTVHISMEIWRDLVNFLGLAVNVAAGLGHHIVCGVVFTAKWFFKTLLPGIWHGVIKGAVSVWKGLVYCWNSVTSSATTGAVYISDVVQIGTKTGGEVIYSIGECLYEGGRSLILALNFTCSTAMTYCIEIWVTTVILVSQIYETLIEKLVHLHDALSRSLHVIHHNLCSVSSEVWLLLIQAVVTGVLIIIILRYLDSHGYTFPSFRQQNRNLENILDESDAENIVGDDISDDESDDDRVSVAESEASDMSNFSTASRRSDASNASVYNSRGRSCSPQIQTPDALARALEHERDRRRCVICQDQSKNVLLLPCRHMCLCGHCAQTLTRTAILYRRICPLCRAPIEAIMSVFV